MQKKNSFFEAANNTLGTVMSSPVMSADFVRWPIQPLVEYNKDNKKFQARTSTKYSRLGAKLGSEKLIAKPLNYLQNKLGGPDSKGFQRLTKGFKFYSRGMDTLGSLALAGAVGQGVHSLYKNLKARSAANQPAVPPKPPMKTASGKEEVHKLYPKLVTPSSMRRLYMRKLYQDDANTMTGITNHLNIRTADFDERQKIASLVQDVTQPADKLESDLLFDRISKEGTFIIEDLNEVRGVVNGGFRSLPGNIESPFYLRCIIPSEETVSGYADLISSVVNSVSSEDGYWTQIPDNNTLLQKAASLQQFEYACSWGDQQVWVRGSK